MRIAALLFLTAVAQGQVPLAAGIWNATFNENSQVRMAEVYFDGRGGYEFRMRSADSNGAVLFYHLETGLSNLNATYDTLFFTRVDTTVEADSNLIVTRTTGLDTTLSFMLFTAISADTVRLYNCDSGVCDTTFPLLFVYRGAARAFTLPDLLAGAAIYGKSKLWNVRRPRLGGFVWKNRPYDILGRFYRPKAVFKR